MNHKLSAILFDLDGTLLPMDNDEFTQYYFKLLCQRFSEYDGRTMIDALWKGVKAMVLNDGAMTNEQRFWKAFSQIMGEQVCTRMEEFNDFYRTDFQKARAVVKPNDQARDLVSWARSAADYVVLATNPVFPMCGVETRLSWIGLTASDFDIVTTYETFSYCKPNPAYYADIARRLGVKPEKCLMIGNDVQEDIMPAIQTGMSAFLLTDWLLSHDLPYDAYPHGDWSDCQRMWRSK